jgi:hypothetical protein
MMEAVRSLGFGARFVSGYLYDPKLDGQASDGTQGAGATHAWCEIYLPGAGWVEYDPTNALIGSESLIRVAVTRDPTQGHPGLRQFRRRRRGLRGHERRGHGSGRSFARSRSARRGVEAALIASPDQPGRQWRGRCPSWPDAAGRAA